MAWIDFYGYLINDVPAKTILQTLKRLLIKTETEETYNRATKLLMENVIEFFQQKLQHHKKIGDFTLSY